MGPFVKKLTQAQTKKNESNALSPTELDSTEDSDSDTSIVLDQVKRNCDKPHASNSPIGQESNDTSSSDEMFSDTLSSESEIKNNEVLSLKVVSLSSNDDLAVSLSRKRQENDLKNQSSKTLGLVHHRSSESENDSDAESRKEILRSAEKRIIRKVSTSESDSRNIRVPTCDKYNTSSESDSAPEDVTFEAGRKKAMEVLKQSVDSIQKEKLRKKEQRKKKLENFRKQKEEKLMRLKHRQKNVENVSSSSSIDLAAKPLAKKNVKTRENKSIKVGKKIYFSSGSDSNERKTGDLKNDVKQSRNLKRLSDNILDSLPDEVAQQQQKQVVSVENEDRIQTKKRCSKMNNSELQWDTDYIPLNSSTVTQFGVVPLNKERKKTVEEEAAAFRHNMLYSKTVKRAPATLHSVRQQKLKICGMDRLVNGHLQ